MTEREIDELVASERQAERGAECARGLPCHLGPWELLEGTQTNETQIRGRRCYRCGRVAITAQLHWHTIITLAETE